MKTTIFTSLLALGMTASANANPSGEKPKATSVISSWVNHHIDYPSDALENKEQGTVYVAFTIKDGNLNEIEVVGSVSSSLDNEVIKTMQNLSVADLGIDMNENTTFILPVKFVLK